MKKFISALLCAVGFSFASMIAPDAIGEEQIAGGSAAMAGRGFAGNAKTGDIEGVSVVNPARQVRFVKTSKMKTKIGLPKSSTRAVFMNLYRLMLSDSRFSVLYL